MWALSQQIGVCEHMIKGYLTGTGYMGYVNGKYILFATESEYIDFMQGK